VIDKELVWNICRVILTGENRNTRTEPVHQLLSPPQTPHRMTCDVTRASVTTGRQLIAQVMFRTRNKASDIPYIGVVSPNKTVPGTDWIRGWMKSRDCLNAVLLRSYCARPSSSQSLYRLSYVGPLRAHKETCNYAIKVKEVPQDCCNAVRRILKNSIN